MKILITGGTGFLGAKLMAILSKEHEVTGTCLTKRGKNCIHLDVTNENQVSSILTQLRPDVVIHTVAISDPDLCESAMGKAWRINVKGTRNIASVCKAIGCKLVYISTDYIFDGRKDGDYNEDDEANPLNYYGLTKLEGEKITQSGLTYYLVIRAPILYGFNDEEDRLTFVTEIIGKLKNDKKVYVDDEQRRYPTLIDDIASAINELIKRDAKGIYHFGSKEGITKYQWALKIAHLYRLPTKNIMRSRASQDKAKRPPNSKLNTSKFESLEAGVNPLGVEEGLKMMKAQMAGLGK